MNKLTPVARAIFVSLLVAFVFVIVLVALNRPRRSPVKARTEVSPDRPNSSSAHAPSSNARRFNVTSTGQPVPSSNVSHTAPDQAEPNIHALSDRPRFIPVKSSGARQPAESEPDPQLQSAATSVRNYRVAFSKNPVGNNREITRALSGKNSLGARYLPADVPINDTGQLIDRWDQPIFFHQISGTVMEVRSAGPDHVMWTADDEVLR